jgi:3-hydroxyacyl-[acyl-carrier-protein] dehydratase
MELSLEDIVKVIPHRYPFLLIDKAIDIKPFESVVGIKCISISDPILQGHFPDKPIYPGVLLLEGLAQTSAVLSLHSNKKKPQNILLTEMGRSRFRRQVVPGDVVHYHVSIERIKTPFYWFKGSALVNGNVVVSTTFSACVR